MNAKEQQNMFKDVKVKIFYTSNSLDDPQGVTVIFQGPENALDDIIVNPQTKPLFEASRHIYEGSKITRWSS